MNRICSILNKQFRHLSNLTLFFWLTLWLMLVLILGTIAQKEIGLYHAQIKYFSSWFFWIGPIPLPSAKPVLAIILVALISQVIFKTNFKNPKKLGISIGHVGSVLLLLGGVITSYFSQEGVMIIPEGKTVNYISDYHELELSIKAKEEPSRSFLIEGKNFGQLPRIIDGLPFTLKMTHFYTNSRFEKRNESHLSDENIGFAKIFEIVEEPVMVEDTDNQAAMNFEIHENQIVKKYSVVQNMPIVQTVTAHDKAYEIELRNKRTTLPFSIQLIDFEKKLHPSTDLPKSFKSTVFLIDGNIKQKTVIQMNEPLRYKDYTFFQSAFSEGQGGETTNLAVVKNYGRTFPYIASIIICIGLLIHLFITSSTLFKNYNKQSK